MSTRKTLSHSTPNHLAQKAVFVRWSQNGKARPVRIGASNLKFQMPKLSPLAKSSRFLRRIFFGAWALSIVANQCFGQAPVVVTQPISQEVSAGVQVVLSVEATGTEPFSYVWFKNGQLIQGGNQPVQGGNQQSLVLTSVSPMASGSYTVRVGNGSGFVTSQVARLQVDDLTAKLIPLDLTGWNQDVVLEDSPVPLATTSFDTLGADWFEAGFAGHSDGLPASGTFTSQFNTNVLFRFQPYIANNVLRLQGSPQANIQGTLTLVTPGPYRSLAILASSAGQSGNTTKLELRFSDGTSVTNLSYVARDWSTPEPANLAISGLGRYQTLEAPAGYQNLGRGFGMYETDIDLAALGLERKFLTELTFTKANDALVTGIFVVSGEPNKIPTVSLQVLPDKRTQVTVLGFPQTSYRIDASSDLVTWIPLVAVASSDGISRFTNAPVSQLSSLFYRVALP